MKHSINEINLDQLADLARGTGVSAHQELPDSLQGIIAESKVTDKTQHYSTELIKRLVGAIKS